MARRFSEWRSPMDAGGSKKFTENQRILFEDNFFDFLLIFNENFAILPKMIENLHGFFAKIRPELSKCMRLKWVREGAPQKLANLFTKIK